MLQVIVISLFVGFGILLAGEKGILAGQVVESFNEVFLKVMDFIIKLSPIGVACLICPVIAENGPMLLTNLIMVLAVAYVGYIVHMVVVYSLTIKTLGGVSPMKFFKEMMPAMMMAFSSASSVGTLPFTMEAAERLGMLAMSYGYIYVAQVALGANPAQLIKALKEAEAYKGPSLIIAYAPCINHGISKGMANAQLEAKLAVDAGYWFLYRYNPDLKKEGKNPFILDSKEPSMDYNDFIMGEVRYASLVRTFPETAKVLLAEAADKAKEKYEAYKKLAEQ